MSRAGRWALAAALLCGLAAAPVSASWVPVGPFGGDVRSLAADPRNPQRVYLGTADGVLFRSEDGGRSWTRLEPGFPLSGMSLDNMTVDPRGRVVVGYWQVAGTGGGVAVSDDAGRSFRLLEGIAGESVRALAVAPSDPDTLTAGTLSGVFLSRDGGASWSRVSPMGDAELRNVESVAIDPHDPEVLYAGTWHLPWKSQDAGRSWHSVHNGMIDDSDVFTLTIDPARPERVFATACTGIYGSSDAGRRWVKVRGIPSSSRRTRSFALGPGDTLYAGTTEGLWASIDGAPWSRLTRPDLIVNAVVAQPDGSVLLGTEGAGVLKSEDRGRTWAGSNAGFSAQFVTRLVAHPGVGLLAALHGSRYHDGVLWAERPEGPWRAWGPGLQGRRVLALAPLGDAAAVAGTDVGVFASTGRGSEWMPLALTVEGIPRETPVRDLIGLPSGVILAASDLGLLRRTGLEGSWERSSLGRSRRVTALAEMRDGSVLAATPLGVHRSRDAGRLWEPLSTGPEGEVRALRVLPGSVFAVTSAGLFRSQDGGESWSREGNGLPLTDVTGLTGDSEGSALYASDFARGAVYYSDDAGRSWRAVATQGLRPERVWDVLMDPTQPGRVVAATAGGGLHIRSADLGDHAEDTAAEATAR